MNTNNPKYEICVESIDRAMEAQAAGAYRVELCCDLTEGGITPSPAFIALARKLLNIKLHPIIRPRGGDFVYSNLEFEIMQEDIRFCGEHKCDGIVTGILNPDGSIDRERNQILADIAKNYDMSATFHRAIDDTPDILAALEDIISLGYDRILTSGGKPTAIAGIDTIRDLIRQAAGRILIMPGSGITKDNVDWVFAQTGAAEIHGTFKSGIPVILTTPPAQSNTFPRFF